MIYTLTLNPAIDYVIGVGGFKTGTINRTSYENIYAGGKGLNVSIVLNNLGVDNVAIGFIAGPTGAMLESMANSDGIKTDFIHCKKGNTRINVKMKSGAEETEINGLGPQLMNEDVDSLMNQISQLTESDMLIISGSAPKGISYVKVCEEVFKTGAQIVLDISGQALLDCLRYKPLLVKPNNIELADMLGESIGSADDVVKNAKKLKELGAQNVMVSMAGDGAILVDAEGVVHICEAPKGTVINSVGAGDTTVAAFIARYLENDSYEDILKYAVSAGSATAFKSGLATKEDIEKMMANLD